MTPRRTATAAALLAACLAVAACTTSSGVTTEEAAATGSTPATGPPPTGPTTTLPTVQVADSTLISEPVADGLPSVGEPDPAIVIGTLDNGLRYFVRENDNPGQRVEMRLAIDAGSALEDDDQVGGAHFLEHMLFNGTERFPENELVAVLRSFGAAFGADINAYTSYDETVYQLTMPSDDAVIVETGLDVLAEWLTAATIAPAAVEAERGVILDEWRGSDQSADGRTFDAIEELMLAGSDYEGKAPIGTADAISTTVDGPLRRFYDDWYRPDNTTVIVVGDIDADEIEQEIVDRFESATSRGSSPERTDQTVAPASDPRVVIHTDPDLAEGFAFVNLPLVRDTSLGPEAARQRQVLDELAFDIVARRMSNAARRGDTPYESAQVDSSSFVRPLDAPEILVEADGAAMEASVQAILDEYERARRYGFSDDEVARAVAARRSVEDATFAGRDSRQDSTFADQYVRHVLEGEPIPTAEAGNDLVTEILDRATPETVAYGLVTRLEATAPHVFVAVPEAEAAEVPPADVFAAMARTVRHRPIDPPVEEDVVPDALMATPAPVDVVDETRLSDGSAVSFVAPVVVEFENGVRVAFNRTQIVEGIVAMEARSVGGLEAVADEDVPDAAALPRVVDASGVGSLDPVALEAFLADKEVGLSTLLDAFTEGFDGFSSTTDLEVLFQLVHLRMTEPGVDPVALERYLDDELPFAADPTIDLETAEFSTLLDARYDDPRYLLPTVDSLASVDADGIERIHRDRFGDAGDWSFSFSGDLDVEVGIELARRYLGTLPATDRVETTDFVEPPPPPGVVVRTVDAGLGDRANVSFLFTAEATADRRDDVAARIVREVVSARLTASIREELGGSYSPFTFVQVGDGPTPPTEVYLSLSTGPELVDSVSTAVLDQLDDLRTAGPTTTEFDAAAETVARGLNLYTNQGINDEVLSVLVDPAGNPSFDDYLSEVFLVAGIDADDLRGYLASWMPADRYIGVEVSPR